MISLCKTATTALLSTHACQATRVFHDVSDVVKQNAA
jgi:hypothetical protein